MKVIVFCLLFGVALAIPTEVKIPIGPKSAEFLKTVVQPKFDSFDTRAQIQLVNEFVDMAINEVSMLMLENQLDPMSLPDLYEELKYTIIITYKGSLNLTEGSLEGLSTVRRNHDVAFDYENRQLRVDVPVGFDTFLFDYHYKVKIMGLGPSGSVEGKGHDVNVNVIIIINFEDMHITLKDFEIVKIGKIDVDFSGNALIDWLINLMTSVVTTLFRGVISWVLENVIKVILSSVIDQINDMLAGLFPEYTLIIKQFDVSHII